MKDIIINQPHLQSFKQKCGSIFLTGLSWMLWLYFLLPLFTLGGWLLGMKGLSDEIRWFGGYKSLLDLLVLYGEIILVIGFCWLIWSFCLSWLHAARPGKYLPTVNEQHLVTAFKVDLQSLQQAKTRNKLTVSFDEHAEITAIRQD